MNLIESINRIKVLMNVITEQSEHTQNLYKNWANKKSGNPEMAMKIMDDVLKYQKKLPKKDFSTYQSYDELISDLNKLKQNESSKDVNVFYKGNGDDDLLVLSPNTWQASCNYGAGSKWCTTSRDDDSYWRRHNETGTEFFWIFRNKPQNDPNHKFSYHIKTNGDTDWCNAINRCASQLPSNSYPVKHPEYFEILKKLKEYHDSRDLKKGYGGLNREDRLKISDWVERNFDLISSNPILGEVMDDVVSNNLKYSVVDQVMSYFDDNVNEDDLYNIYDEMVGSTDFRGILNDDGFHQSFLWIITEEIDENQPEDLDEYLDSITKEDINDFINSQRGYFYEVITEILEPELFELVRSNVDYEW